jgi:WD40 repeat protein
MHQPCPVPIPSCSHETHVLLTCHAFPLFLPAGSSLDKLSTTPRIQVYLFSMHQLVAELYGHQMPANPKQPAIQSLSFIPGSSDQLVSAGGDGCLIHWSTADGGKLLRTLNQYQQPVHTMSSSHSGEYVASSALGAVPGDELVLVHSLVTGQEVLRVPIGSR